MAELALERLSKRFGSTVAVDELDLGISDGELVTLLGPSGSGKTTALRMIAGFVEPDSGAIRIDGDDVTRLPPEQRDIGMVFQSYALFPHRRVFGNVSFGLERRRLARAAIDARVDRVLELVRLHGLRDRWPRELSGGQQQRVALARALVIEPRLLLLDEPLSNLDAGLRIELRQEIRRIQRTLGITTVLVTHDQEEALSISDRIAVLRAGKLHQLGAPEALYRRPADRFVAEFLGKMNLLEAERVGPSTYRLRASGQTIQAPAGDEPNPALVGVRPEVVRVGSGNEGRAEGVNRARARLARSVFLGELSEHVLTLGEGVEIRVRGSQPLDCVVGDEVELCWPVDETTLYGI